MPIPSLTPDGLLPPGVHACTVAEIETSFSANAKRSALCVRLKAYLEECRTTEMIAWVAVDGSFTTAKPDPNDIDLVVVLRAEHDLTAEIRPFECNLVSRKRVKKNYDFDILVGPEGTEIASRHLSFFQSTRDGRRKGILRVNP